MLESLKSITLVREGPDKFIAPGFTISPLNLDTLSDKDRRDFLKRVYMDIAARAQSLAARLGTGEVTIEVMDGMKADTGRDPK